MLQTKRVPWHSHLGERRHKPIIRVSTGVDLRPTTTCTCIEPRILFGAVPISILQRGTSPLSHEHTYADAVSKYVRYPGLLTITT